MKNFKKILLLFLFIFLIFEKPSYSIENEDKPLKVLLLCSYTYDNRWENSVIRGLKDTLPTQSDIHVEFLDLDLNSTKEYKDNLHSLLNEKYSSKDFDTIVALDDEAFSFSREYIKNEDSIFYKRKIVFLGVNDYVFLSDIEREYITGILEYQDNHPLVNTILSTSKDIENIYVILDNSIYCETLKRSFLSSYAFGIRNYNLEFIQSDDFETMLKGLNVIDYKTSAIILCGDYSKEKNGKIIPSETTISSIAKVTKAPIYTTIDHYVVSGAIGGIVNDGEALGKMCAFLISKVVALNEPLTPIYNTLSISYFNFKAMRKYGVNPLKIPVNSEVINKKPFEVMLPLSLQILIWLSVLLFILGIIIIIILFIKERKSSKTIKSLLAESERKSEIKTDFIITISHELRTPLNIILNATKLIEHKLNLSKHESNPVKKELYFINKNSFRLQKLINNIIDVSKLETGFMDVSFKMGNIVEVIEDTTLSIVEYAKYNNISLLFDTDEEEIITGFDKVKIERIMLNLLSNSIKYNKENGEVYVTVSCLEENIIIEVRDTGIGISKKLTTEIFEKFKRGTSLLNLEREKEGSGLGLFIVKRLVDIHKGTISVESEVNVGTTFTISIPIVTLEIDDVASSNVNDDLDTMVNLEFSDID